MKPETKARYQEMAALYAAGSTLREIGVLCGVSKQRIHQILASIGVDKKHGGRSVISASRRGTTLTAEKLREQLSYDSETGIFFRRVSIASRVRVGQAAGFYTDSGHIRVSVLGKSYLAHRLAWLYVHGEWPAGKVEHINRMRDDNRIANLREADRIAEIAKHSEAA